ncbi:MAG: methylglyoxal synthase [Anaerovoracaceae bacterium]
MEKQKRIALIAHDNLKDELVKWCIRNKEDLRKHFLCGTGTTSKLIAGATGLPIKGYKSGPLGGDQQIGARIAEGEIDVMIFFWDPLEAQPHDPDIKALLRIAVVYDIPVANNSATADFIMTSKYMANEYTHRLLSFQESVENTTKEII